MPEKAAKPFFGSWAGINERNPAPNQLRDGWNLDFEGGVIYRRKGRVPLVDYSRWRPLQAVTMSAAVYSDITETLTDNLTTTAAPALDIAGGGGQFLVGMPFPFSRLLWEISGGGAGASTTLEYRYWNGSAWTSFSSVTDTTIVSGSPMKQSGYMTWDIPSTWRTGHDFVNIGVNVHQGLYWVMVRNAGANAIVNYTPHSLFVSLLEKSGRDLRTPTSGLHEWKKPGGERTLVVAMDFPGPHLNVFSSQIPPTPRLATVDFGDGSLRPIYIPDEAKYSTNDAYWNFISWNGYLLGVNGSGAVVRYDGRECFPLEALEGRDAQEYLPNPKTYLASVPRGRLMCPFRNQLAIAGIDGEEDAFYLSEYDNADLIIPGDAPVGGPNLWPADRVFRAVTVGGDAITSIYTVNDRLCILKKRSVFSFDDASLRCVNDSVGCIAPRSAATNGQIGFFLSQDGVRAFDGVGLSESLSGPVSLTLDEYASRQSLHLAVGALFSKRHEYRLYIPVGGEQRNRVCLVYNYKDKTWSKHGAAPDWYAMSDADSFSPYEVCAATAIDGLGADEYLVTGDYSGQLWREHTGDDDNGYGFDSVMVFPRVGGLDETLETYRYARFEMLMSGERFDLHQMHDGMDHRAKIRSYPSYSSSDAQQTALRSSGQAQYSSSTITPPLEMESGSGLSPSRRFSSLRFSLGKTARNNMIALVSHALTTGAANVGGPTRWAIKGYQLEATPREGKR